MGFPYAAPPTGENRWRPPQAPASWTGVRQTTSFGASCAQQRFPNGLGEGTPWTREYTVDPDSAISEDCLFANVWTPAKAATERLPVYVYIHGGGFNQGSGSIPIYDGAALAAHGIIVVNFNYRVEVFGFLALPELTKESPQSTSGNYGLLDMIAALEWVHDNIAAFGGDPSKVTIGGQSAGASAVHDLAIAPRARELFVGAIAESGSRPGGPGMPLAKAEGVGLQFMKLAGASDLAGLRAMSYEQLIGVAHEGMRFGPIVDGVVIPVGLGEALATGQYNDTPFLTGFTADEGSSSPNYGKTTLADFKDMLQKRFGGAASKWLEQYPASDDAQASEMSKQLSRDQNLAGMYAWAEERLKTTSKPIFEYLYTHPEPGPNAGQFGAFHSSEVPYIFQTLDKSPGRTFTDQDREIASKMSAYWTNFVRLGDPNGGDLPEWPAFNSADKQIMELGDNFEPRPVLSPEKLALFEEAMSNR